MTEVHSFSVPEARSLKARLQRGHIPSAFGDPFLPFCLCRHVSFPLCVPMSSHGRLLRTPVPLYQGPTSCWSALILTDYICNDPISTLRPHSEVLGSRTSIYHFRGGHSSTYNRDSSVILCGGPLTAFPCPTPTLRLLGRNFGIGLALC